MSLVTSLLAVVATARLLPQDLEDRTIYTILAKPVPRFEYLLGKLFGILLLLALSLLLMSALFILVLYSREQVVLSETTRQMSAAPHDQMEAALRNVRAHPPSILICYRPSPPFTSRLFCWPRSLFSFRPLPPLTFSPSS